MRRKKLSSVFLIAAFLFTIVLPVAIPQPADAAVIDTVATEMGEVYTCIDPAEKGAIVTAKGNINNLTVLSDAELDAIVAPLLTKAVTDKYISLVDPTGVDTARARMKVFAKAIASFYYSSDATTLNADLTTFKATFGADFHLLFDVPGDPADIDDLFQLLLESRKELPGAVIPHIVVITTGDNAALLAVMPNIMKSGLNAALAKSKLNARITALGWSGDILIDQQQAMANKIDSGFPGQLALMKAAVRSRTKLYNYVAGSPLTLIPTPGGVGSVTLAAGSVTQYRVKIFDKDATGLLKWNSSSATVGELNATELATTGFPIITGKTAGNTVLAGSRTADTSNWVVKLNVTYTSGGGGGGGGGGSVTVIPPKTTEEEKEVKEPEVKEPNIVSFNDIQGHWAEAKIKSLQQKGIITGYPDGSFQPDKTISRAEFLAMIIKAFNLTGTDGKTFSDTVNHWAKDVISIAIHNGIAAGYNEESFGPDDPITREQMAVVIAMVKHLTGNGTSKTFTDADLISAWAKVSVDAVTESGLMTGYENNTFDPQKPATRAEAAVVIYNMINK